MSLHIFGSGRVDTFKKEEQKAVGGLSLSYVASNFFRRGQLIDMSNRRITNLAPPRTDKDAATKEYVDNNHSNDERLIELNRKIQEKKTLITVWAEERGPLVNNQYEWSFGDGAVGRGTGYIMLANGRILRMGLTCTYRRGTVPEDATVKIVVNGAEKNGYQVRKLGNQLSEVSIFPTPLEVSQGDVIEFISKDTTRTAINSIVNLLIELNI